MRLTFEFDPENGQYYAVSDNVIYNEQLVDSLWWAEVVPTDEGFIVIFDDQYRNKILKPTLEEAKEYILSEYSQHTPQIVGKRYDFY